MFNPLDRIHVALSAHSYWKAIPILLIWGIITKCTGVNKPQPITTPSGFLRAGLSKTMNGDLVKAEKLFNQALALNSEFAPAVQGIGLIHLQKGEHEAAYKQFSKAIELYEKQEDPLAARYAKIDLKQLKNGERPRCLRYFDNGIQGCAFF